MIITGIIDCSKFGSDAFFKVIKSIFDIEVSPNLLFESGLKLCLYQYLYIYIFILTTAAP